MDNHLTEQIKAKLEAGEVLTVVSVQRDLHTTELRHYLPIIKRRFGLSIGSTWREDNGKRFKVYFLNKAA